MPEIAVATWFPVLTLLLGFGAKALADWGQRRFVTAADRALGRMGAVLNELNGKTGEVLRGLDDAEEQRAV